MSNFHQEELIYWLAFDSLKGIGLGPKRIKNLFDHFSSLQRAWLADESELKEIETIPAGVIEAFVRERQHFSLEKPLEKVYRYGIKAITQIDPLYPHQLNQLVQPPLVIYAKGIWDLNWFEKSIGIVGTREASDYALTQTRQISSQLASMDFTIISGMALGIDSAAHYGAFDVQNSRCVAVVANGVEQIVPASSRPIYKALMENGLVLSEYPPEILPEKGYFPARNRIVAALSQAVLVSEAGARSGALITAERAIEMKKPVFGLVGRADNKQSEGIHRWIRKGLARLITSTEDILEEMEMLSSMPSQINMLEDASIFLAEQKKQSTMQRKSSEKKDVEKNNSSNQKTTQSNTKSIDIASLNESEKNIYSTLLGADSISMDRLVELTSMPIHKINSTLMTLELKKIIKRQGPSICRA